MFRRHGRSNKAVALISTSPLGTCCSQLNLKIDQPWTIMGDRPVIGRIYETKLWMRKRIRYRNPFQILLRARLFEQAGSTHIQCYFSMRPFVVIFLTMWFGGVLLLGGGVFLMCLAGLILAYQSMPAGTWMGLLIPPWMVLFGFGIIQFGRYLARDERQFLLDFLCETLMARPVDLAAQTS